ncbi:hypothetical protein [Streptomyces sp. NPDC058812]
MWESEKLRPKTGIRPAVPEAPALSATEQPRTAVHALRLRAGMGSTSTPG